MQLLMGSSLLVAGLLASSIPILIHLLHRQKTRPVPWGAMMFLRQSPLNMKRKKQVEHWILLLLRTLVLIFLAWLLARPLFNSPRLNPLAGNQPADVAIVLDHSMSMGRHNGDHTLFDEAQSVVDKLTDVQSPVLRGGDTLSLILAEHRPRALTPLPINSRDSASLARLRDGVHGLKLGATDCTIPEAIEAAREIVRKGLNRRKVVIVVSDEQRTNWDVGDSAAWQRAVGDAADYDRRLEVYNFPLAVAEPASNVTVNEIAIQPSMVGMGRPVELTSKIANSGPNDIPTLSVHASINGKEIGAPQVINNLGAGQSITVRFDHTFTTPGSSWVRIWTDVVDALAADNESVASIHVWQKLPVLVIDGALTRTGGFKSSQFLAAAMLSDNVDASATSLIQPEIISVSDSGSVKLDDYYAVILNDVPQLPAEVQTRLPGYVSSGHGLWIVMGPRTTQSSIESFGKSPDGGPSLFRAEIVGGRRNEKIPPPVEIKDSNNPMVSAIVSAERNALSSAVTKQWWSIKPKDADAEVVLASTTGDPLIIDRPMKDGRVVVWTTSAEKEWNSWPAMPNFVPLVNETIYHLSAAQTRWHASGSIAAGESIVWSGPQTPAVQKVDVTLPDGSQDSGRKAVFRNGRWEFTWPNAFLPGLYQLHFAPTDVPQPVFYGVSIDRRELDNTPLSGDDQEWLHKGKYLDGASPRIDASQLAYVITRSDPGVEMWKLLAGVVVLSLLGETFMTWRVARLQKNVDVAGAGLMARV